MASIDEEMDSINDMVSHDGQILEAGPNDEQIPVDLILPDGHILEAGSDDEHILEPVPNDEQIPDSSSINDPIDNAQFSTNKTPLNPLPANELNLLLTPTAIYLKSRSSPTDLLHSNIEPKPYQMKNCPKLAKQALAKNWNFNLREMRKKIYKFYEQNQKQVRIKSNGRIEHIPRIHFGQNMFNELAAKQFGNYEVYNQKHAGDKVMNTSEESTDGTVQLRTRSGKLVQMDKIELIVMKMEQVQIDKVLEPFKSARSSDPYYQHFGQVVGEMNRGRVVGVEEERSAEGQQLEQQLVRVEQEEGGQQQEMMMEEDVILNGNMAVPIFDEEPSNPLPVTNEPDLNNFDDLIKFNNVEPTVNAHAGQLTVEEQHDQNNTNNKTKTIKFKRPTTKSGILKKSTKNPALLKKKLIIQSKSRQSKLTIVKSKDHNNLIVPAKTPHHPPRPTVYANRDQIDTTNRNQTLQVESVLTPEQTMKELTKQFSISSNCLAKIGKIGKKRKSLDDNNDKDGGGEKFIYDGPGVKFRRVDQEREVQEVEKVKETESTEKRSPLSESSSADSDHEDNEEDNLSEEGELPDVPDLGQFTGNDMAESNQLESDASPVSPVVVHSQDGVDAVHAVVVEEPPTEEPTPQINAAAADDDEEVDQDVLQLYAGVLENEFDF